MSKRRRGPSSPEEIAARAALRRGLERAGERAAARDPTLWGINPRLDKLSTSGDVTVVKDPNRRGKIRNARRSDAFTLLYEAGGLSDGQYAASQRYWKDWAVRGGANLGPGGMAEVKVDAGQAGHDGVSQRMVDAGNRILEAHEEIGRGSALLLTALVEPLALRGEVRVWRAQVEAVTGESERHAQAAAVRAALQNLCLAYEAIDRRPKRPRLMVPVDRTKVA